MQHGYSVHIPARNWFSVKFGDENQCDWNLHEDGRSFGNEEQAPVSVPVFEGERLVYIETFLFSGKPHRLYFIDYMYIYKIYLNPHNKIHLLRHVRIHLI